LDDGLDLNQVRRTAFLVQNQ